MEWDFFNEITDKAMHILIIIILIGYFAIENQAGKQIALISLLCVFAIFLILEYLRVDLDMKMPFLSFFVRPKEQHKMSSIVLFLSATLISLAIFDSEIAFTAILMSTFGDIASAIFGKKYGATLIYKNKTIVGSSAGLVTNVIIALVVTLVVSANIYVLLAMALVASIVETLLDDLDDNLAVPVFAGLIGQILRFIL